MYLQQCLRILEKINILLFHQYLIKIICLLAVFYATSEMEHPVSKQKARLKILFACHNYTLTTTLH